VFVASLVMLSRATLLPQSARDSGRITGTVVDAATKLPFAGVRILMTPGNLASQTNEVGEFAFDIVPSGNLQLVTISPAMLECVKKAARLPVKLEFQSRCPPVSCGKTSN
jgi:hypothetical protein